MININNLNYTELCKITKEKGCSVIFPTTRFMKHFVYQLSDIYSTISNNLNKTNKIIQLQRWWRHINPRFNCFNITTNIIEPFSLINITDIQPNHQISINENSQIYMFDIRYLYKELYTENIYINPFTNLTLTNQSIKRINEKIHTLQKQHIDIQLDEELITDEQLLIRRYEKIVCKINRLGYTHVNIDWLLMPYNRQLDLYFRLAYIWYTVVSPEFRYQFNHLNTGLFNNLYLLQSLHGQNYSVIRQIILLDLERIFSNSIEPCVQSQCVIYLLMALNELHPGVNEYYHDMIGE